MKRLAIILRNGILGLVTLGVFAGLVSFDHHLRRDPARQASRYLEAREVPAVPAAAVASAAAGEGFRLEQRKRVGAGPNLEAEPGLPGRWRAAGEERWDHFGFLLSRGADPDAVDETGLSALARAVGRRDGERIQALVRAGASVDRAGVTGDALLAEAIGRGDPDLADTLPGAGAPADAHGAAGQTALMAAVKAGSVPLAELLLSRGADPNRPDADRVTPLEIATRSKDVDLMQMLIGSGADARQPELIRHAVRERDIPSLSLLLRSGADPETAVGRGRQLLDEAIEARSPLMARLLLEAGASPAGRLWAAFDAGDERLGELLLFHGASPSERAPDGRLPMDHALGNGRGRLVRTLLDGGANPNGRGPAGEAWVARAIREGNEEAAEALIDRGACLDGLSAADGHSLLGWAIARRLDGVVDRLIRQGADVAAREPAPASEAFTAAFTRSKTFRWHLQADARINPLMLAAAQGDSGLAKKLIEAGARKGDYSKRYLWPVNIAAWHGDVEMMQVIFGRDPDPDNQPRKVVIDLGSQKATLYEQGEATYTTRVSTGKPGYRTPTGTFVITDKHRHHTSSIYDASMPYFMRLSCAAFGLHQGIVPGYPASHGCIRVPQAGAKHLFSICEVGDVVEIRH